MTEEWYQQRPEDEVFFPKKDRLVREGFESTAALRWLPAWEDGPRLLALVLEAPSPLRLPGSVPEVLFYVSICFEAPRNPEPKLLSSPFPDLTGRAGGGGREGAPQDLGGAANCAIQL